MVTLKEKLIDKLEEIPGIEHRPWPSRDDGFSTLHLNDKEIGHFHNFNELDLRLGKKLIKSERLKQDFDSTHHPNRSPNSSYFEFRFQRTRDLDKIVRLVKLLADVRS